MAKARVKVLEQVCDPTEAKAIVLADVRTEAAAAAKFLEDAEANAGAKALEEAKAALAMVHTDVARGSGKGIPRRGRCTRQGNLGYWY